MPAPSGYALLQLPSIHALNPPAISQFHTSSLSVAKCPLTPRPAEMGLLCDCFGKGPKTSPSKEARSARSAKVRPNPPSYSSLPPDVLARSPWRRSQHSERLERAGVAVLTAEDEKHLLQMTIDEHEMPGYESEPEPEPEAVAESGSPQSSTVSLPSTRITVRTLFSDITGASSASRRSRRSQESEFTTGAPPSYRPRSETSRYGVGSNQSSWDPRHSVLNDEWFDQFREHTVVE